MRPDDTERIIYAKQLFEKHIDASAFEEKLFSINVKGITPKMFQYNLVQHSGLQFLY